MTENNRILILGRQPEVVETVTRILETVGCTVASTLSDEVAIDLAGSSGYDALIIEGEVSETDSRYVTRKARSVNSSIAVIVCRAPESALTQLRQAGISL